MGVRTMSDELKTLKDLPCYHEADCVERKDLKAEAIKWIKHIGETTENENTEENVEISNWIKHFFNLTEEDLLECDHDFRNMIFLSYPAQKRCIKCGYTEYLI